MSEARAPADELNGKRPGKPSAPGLGRATSLKERLDPRVALTGPKGSGKTIYRQYLAHGMDGLPPFLTETMGVRSPGWAERAARRVEYRAFLKDGKVDHKGWAEVPEALPRPLNIDGMDYLGKVAGTDWLTVHALPLPDLRGRARRDFHKAAVLDFPGEHWGMVTDPTRDGYYEACEKEDVTLLGRCRMLLFLVPFWLVLPRALRRVPTQVDVLTHNHLTKLSAGDGTPEQHAGRICRERDQALFRSARDWIPRLEEALSGKEKPRLVVVFTQLGAEWRGHLQDPDGPIGRSLGRVRGLISHPLANNRPARFQGLVPRPGWLPEWVPWRDTLRQAEVARWYAAAGFRRLLDDLHEELKDMVRQVREVPRAQGTEQQLLQKLDSLLEEAGPGRVRYMAMNVVSDRYIALHDQQPVVHAPYLALEAAGAMLPSAYLCGSLDLLA